MKELFFIILCVPIVFGFGGLGFLVSILIRKNRPNFPDWLMPGVLTVIGLVVIAFGPMRQARIARDVHFFAHAPFIWKYSNCFDSGSQTVVLDITNSEGFTLGFMVDRKTRLIDLSKVRVPDEIQF